MDTVSVFGCQKVMPFGFSLSKTNIVSLGPSNKQLQIQVPIKNSQNQKSCKDIHIPLRCSLSISANRNFPNLSGEASQNRFYPYPSSSLLSSPTTKKTHFHRPIKCSYSNTANPDFENPLLKITKNIQFASLVKTLSELNPLSICKLSLILSVLIAATKWTVNSLFNPFVWMYFSWTWLFWPWLLAIGLAIYGIYCLRKHLNGEANVLEQIAIVTSSFTWLTLVPPAHFNGYLEGWPFVFFLVYHYFFFFNVSVRKRLYGDYYPREHDPKWDINPPNWSRLLFCVGVMVGHWLAAFEAPELHLIPGGWSNLGIWVLIMTTLFMQYHSTLYLSKYSEKVVVPTAVVQFGPYRWVRHPIYASTMLMFVTYCVALRAPISSLFVIAVCLLYYGQKAKLEEDLMIETFGESYIDYRSRVRYKLIPFVY